ncbi:S8/S53 family peptidase [Streptacidiphilus sp. PB12-B1b]|uniref:S53 family peptidase n=1 Tax=Streptacidiphilus sp. PB12-B1b TaxID=2705012 RepID=UPI0015F8CCEE|nr:S53 family peptidase [Streptacidiphilus sp. PB12-B1b]QMU75623.1 S8/S53 family peptidase [Streptacidiphilus sp. PB12-B1b]
MSSLALATGSLALAAPSQAVAPAPQAKVITSSHPSWATAAADKGAVSASAQTSVTVYLQSQNAAALAQYAMAVSTPGNALYGKFLTAAQAKARFLATPAQIKAVQTWLTGAGLHITSSSEHQIQVSGDAAAIKRAFGTTLHQYSVKGHLLHAPTTNAVVPAAVSSVVLGVSGLASSAPTVKPTYVPVSEVAKSTGASAKKGIAPTPTCSTSWDQKKVTGAPAGYTKNTYYDECSFQPSQLRQAYGITKSGLTGKGVKIAIVDAYGSSTMLADADQYSTNHGDQPFAAGQYTEVVTPDQWNSQAACGGPAGWAPEEALDVEMSHGLAPAADVVYVGANSCNDNDLQAALADIVDNHLADIVSNSWSGLMYSNAAGDGESAISIAAYEQIFEQGAVEGIGFDFSAGDCGNNSPGAAATGVNCDPSTTKAQAGFPSSDPLVTDVGGTALAISDKKGDYKFETDMGTLLSTLNAAGTGWNPLPGSFYFGGGGGTSDYFAQPFYQKGIVPDALSHTLMTGATSSTAQRVTPDVAMNGDLFTSVWVGISDGNPYSEGGYGGTSVSSPEWTALQADAIQARGGRPFGFANPEIYDRAGTKDFNDVVNETAVKGQPPLSAIFDNGLQDGSLNAALVAFGRDYGLVATRGFDDATGVGSPNVNYLNSYKKH